MSVDTAPTGGMAPTSVAPQSATPIKVADEKELSFLHIFGLIALPALAIVPWILFLTPLAACLGLRPDFEILSVAGPIEGLKGNEFASRITALSNTVLLLIVAGAAGGIAVGLIWKLPVPERYWTKYWKTIWKFPVVRGAWVTWFAVLAVVIVFLWLLRLAQIQALFGSEFYQKTVGRISSGLPRLLEGQLYVSMLVVAFGASALAAVATSIVQQAREVKTKESDETKFNVLSRRLDVVLFASAAILVVGVLDAKAWSDWPAPLVFGKDTATLPTDIPADPRVREIKARLDKAKEESAAAKKALEAAGPTGPESEAAEKERVEKARKVDELTRDDAILTARLKNNWSIFQSLRDAYIAFQGICYVGVLILIYFPAAAALNRARARMGSPPSSSFGMDQLLRVLALVAPLIAGPLKSFLDVKLIAP